MKVLIALASLLALCAGQLTNLTNSQELDPAGNFRLSWEVIAGTGDIVLEIQAKAAGWVSLEIVTDDGKYADVIFGGYNDEFSFGYLEDWSLEWTPGAHLLPIPDASKDLILQSASFSSPNTIVRVKRSLNTGDYYDVPIHSGQMPIGWSYSTSDAYDSVHAAAGFVYVTFF
ncbi:hypothetical protein DAPPUDRAFT_223556 [Daphnia pulex]|uniref:DOMON domain-containing protein n=1 Tax=Daphnia pulex TaxID=6669 RepID=E9GBS0_DAPPU|nr:hypothetical protein DAPPUDRAFT_223556 [Daphnia pulex]|eukprot:EFX83108.1 hypothetical protein DAPPUDRAFT_223556 [Daphnia pulex]